MTNPLAEQLAPLVQRVEDAAPGRVLDQVTAAVCVGEELNRLGDVLINFFVEAARTAGHSWAEIGTSLGVSRQAAQQRLGRFQQVPMDTDGIRQKGSPFVVWHLTDSEEIEVQVEPGGAWHRLQSLDGFSVPQLIDASRKTDPKKWFKRMAEDLDEVYKELGAALGPTANAVLVDSAGRSVSREVDVTIAKRKAVWQHNRDRSDPDIPPKKSATKKP